MRLQDWIKTHSKTYTDTDLRYLLKNIIREYALSSSNSGCVLGLDQLKELSRITQVYKEGKPLAYILGKEEFYGFEFKINSDVLIPRKETEIIVEKAINISKSNNLAKILDLGCGSGNIGITLARELNQTIYCSDLSAKALKVSSQNAQDHKAQVNFVNADLFSGFKEAYFDLIVSNPPYVESDNIKGSLTFEPKSALWAGLDGLYFLEKIINQAPVFLTKGGFLILEMGYKHKEAIRSIVDKNNDFSINEWIIDYSGYDRGVILKKINNG